LLRNPLAFHFFAEIQRGLPPRPKFPVFSRFIQVLFISNAKLDRVTGLCVRREVLGAIPVRHDSNCGLAQGAAPRKHSRGYFCSALNCVTVGTKLVPISS
jgi:hypothetical protein